MADHDLVTKRSISKMVHLRGYMYMYIDNYGDITKYTKYMIVLDYYTHTEKLDTKQKRKGIKDIHKERRKKKENKVKEKMATFQGDMQ